MYNCEMATSRLHVSPISVQSLVLLYGLLFFQNYVLYLILSCIITRSQLYLHVAHRWRRLHILGNVIITATNTVGYSYN
jgi:hypothetical protein